MGISFVESLWYLIVHNPIITGLKVNIVYDIGLNMKLRAKQIQIK